MICTCATKGPFDLCPVHGDIQHWAGAAHPPGLNAQTLLVGGD